MRLALDEPDNLLRHIYALEQKAVVGWLVGWLVGIWGFSPGCLWVFFLSGGKRFFEGGGGEILGLLNIFVY